MIDLNIEEGYLSCFQHKPLCIKYVLPHLLLLGLQDESGLWWTTHSVTPASWGLMERGRHKVSQGKVWEMNWKENIKPVASSANTGERGVVWWKWGNSENTDHLQVKIMAIVGWSAQNLGQKAPYIQLMEAKQVVLCSGGQRSRTIWHLLLPHFLLALKKVRFNISLAKMPSYHMGLLELSCATWR